MPVSNDTGKKLPANKQKGKKICPCCKEEKNLTKFYLNYSPMYSIDQRSPICAECCKTYALNEDGTINNDKLKDLLRQIDRPLYYDDLSSAISSVKRENSYLTEEETKFHGYDILGKYFTLIAARQNRAKSYSDSEREGFCHQNSNRTMSEKNQILNTYMGEDTSDDENLKPKEVKEVQISKKDEQNMNYVLSTIGYDPFDDVGLLVADKKYCCNILSGYLDTDGITEDGNKMQGVIEITMMYCQCKKITEAMNLELQRKNVDDAKIAKLTSAKSSLLSSISKIAQDNNISSNYNKNSKQGQNSISSKMKEMAENGFEEIRVNLFDIKTSEAFQQIDAISNNNIANQLTLDNNEFSDMVKEQREMIQKYEKDALELKEENRILKNKIIDLENGLR